MEGSGSISLRLGMCMKKAAIDVGLVAKHAVLHEASPDNSHCYL